MLPASLSPHCQQYLCPETAGSRGARILGQPINRNFLSLGTLLILGAVQVGTGTTFNKRLEQCEDSVSLSAGSQAGTDPAGLKAPTFCLLPAQRGGPSGS